MSFAAEMLARKKIFIPSAVANLSSSMHYSRLSEFIVRCGGLNTRRGSPGMA